MQCQFLPGHAKTGGSTQRQLPEPPIHLLPKVLALRRDDGLKATQSCVAVPLHEGMAKRTAVCVGCPNELTVESVSLDALTCKLNEQLPTDPEPAQQRDAKKSPRGDDEATLAPSALAEGEKPAAHCVPCAKPLSTDASHGKKAAVARTALSHASRPSNDDWIEERPDAMVACALLLLAREQDECAPRAPAASDQPSSG